MGKYNSLWEYVQKKGTNSFKLTFEEIQNIAGIPIDHSFLKYKKELTEYGYEVGKISMKEQTVLFNKLDSLFFGGSVENQNEGGQTGGNRDKRKTDGDGGWDEYGQGNGQRHAGCVCNTVDGRAYGGDGMEKCGRRAGRGEWNSGDFPGGNP